MNLQQFNFLLQKDGQKLALLQQLFNYNDS